MCISKLRASQEKTYVFSGLQGFDENRVAPGCRGAVFS
jgi:hypothetical protein